MVTKLDRLCRNASDGGTTVAKLADMGVRVHCLALGGIDLTSSSGKLTMTVINAVTEFESDRLSSAPHQGRPQPDPGGRPETQSGG